MDSGRGASPDDLRAMIALCRRVHMAGDPTARKRELLDGLCELFGAPSGTIVVAHVERAPRRHTILSSVQHGTAAGREEQLLARFIPALEESMNAGPSGSALRAWVPLAWPKRARRGLRLCHCVRSRINGEDGAILACVSIARRGGAPPFTLRERRLLRSAHTEMSWIYDADFALATRGADALSRRQRQTLQYLLAGHSEKQIALEMRLSPNTVHHYVKALHRHFNVSSRSELLARWVK